MAWLCLKDNALSGSQMCIVTGPRIDLAIALIDRIKKLFAGKHINTFDTKEIEAFPSHHLDLSYC
jgi:late competence protein required for DNA uptake (superfamily II DNA/RNA helicase)